MEAGWAAAEAEEKAAIAAAEARAAAAATPARGRAPVRMAARAPPKLGVRARAEGFEGEDSSDWFYGFIFFVFIAFILSPGVLLTIPPGRGGIFMSRNTSIIAALVHALLLGVIISSI
jgi:hypothetical protein